MKIEQAVEQLRHRMRLQHLAWKTEQSYVSWLRRYAGYLVALPQAKVPATREKKLEAFLTYLARDRKVGAVTQNQAFNALRYFYEQAQGEKLGDVSALRARTGTRHRQAPTVGQVAAVRASLRDTSYAPIRLLADLIYGCGLRVSEPLNLRIKDLELDRSQIIIRGAKGNKDRVVKVPRSCMAALKAQAEIAVKAWDDARRSTPAVPVTLPDGMARKYQRAAYSKAWFWVFPAPSNCSHPRTGEIVRWRLHESHLQRAVKRAAAAAGLEYIVTPHHLRHAYATHQLARGVDIKTIGESMGHVSIETTAGYCHPHVAAGNPLDNPPEVPA